MRIAFVMDDLSVQALALADRLMEKCDAVSQREMARR